MGSGFFSHSGAVIPVVRNIDSRRAVVVGRKTKLSVEYDPVGVHIPGDAGIVAVAPPSASAVVLASGFPDLILTRLK